MSKQGPTFLGIGAQKAGTTWLSQQLSRHPEVWIAPGKEIHYFDRDPRYFSSPRWLSTSSPFARLVGSNAWERPQMKTNLVNMIRSIRASRFGEAKWWARLAFGYYGDRWYRKLFSAASTAKHCGEITPSYSILESEDVARIKAVNPDMKLLFIIRNPMERAWSAVRYFNHRSGNPFKTDDQILSYLKRSYVLHRGDYEKTLNTYLKHFDREQILVCFYDAIQQDPTGLIAGVADFLSIGKCGERIDSCRRVNASPARPVPKDIKRYLVDTYSPMIERLSDRLGSYALNWVGTESGSGPATPSNLSATVHP